MRLNYYQFSETVDPHTRWINGADALKTECKAGIEDDVNCVHLPEGARGCIECPQLHCIEAGDAISGISVSTAKKLLRQFGGSAWTYHSDREGSVFETTEIELTGNNSRFKYNKHL